MNKTGITMLIVVVLVVAGGAFALTKNSKKTTTPTTTQTTTTSETKSDSNKTPDTTNNTDNNAAKTITYNEGGFSPSTLTVKSGATVTIKNDSSKAIQFDSDPHPIHTTNKELNVEQVGAGESKTFTVTKTGTFGYHDHLDPSMTGTIIVE